MVTVVIFLGFIFSRRLPGLERDQPGGQDWVSHEVATMIILLGNISVSLLFASMAVIIYVDFPAQQEKLLEQGDSALADNLRRQIEPAVLTNDRFHLNEAISKAKLSDKDIEYVLVLDAAGDPIENTHAAKFYYT
jgi:hypothetical protein